MFSCRAFFLLIVLCYFQYALGYFCCQNVYSNQISVYQYPYYCQNIVPCRTTSTDKLLKARCPMHNDFEKTGGSGIVCEANKSCSDNELCCLNELTGKRSCKLGVYYTDDVTPAPLPPRPQCPKPADFDQTDGSDAVCNRTVVCTSNAELCCPDLKRLSYRCKHAVFY